jgi:hypothetical protein
VNGTAELFLKVSTSPAAKVSIAVPEISPTATRAETVVEGSTAPFTAIAIAEPIPAVMRTL